MEFFKALQGLEQALGVSFHIPYEQLACQ